MCIVLSLLCRLQKKSSQLFCSLSSPFFHCHFLCHSVLTILYILFLPFLLIEFIGICTLLEVRENMSCVTNSIFFSCLLFFSPMGHYHGHQSIQPFQFFTFIACSHLPDVRQCFWDAQWMEFTRHQTFGNLCCSRVLNHSPFLKRDVHLIWLKSLGKKALRLHVWNAVHRGFSVLITTCSTSSPSLWESNQSDHVEPLHT